MDVLAALTQIGFTEYEAKVYLALLADFPATGYQISKRSSVPRSMVYETLSRLHARGAVMETVEERATYYRPVPPDVLLDRHQAELATLMGGLRQGLERLYAARPEDSVWSISGRRTILAYARQMIARSAQELYLVLADPDAEELRPEVLAACARGVAVNTLLTGQSELPCGQVLRHPPLESQIQGLTTILLVLADSGEVLIANQGQEMSATITRNANLLLIARQFVWMELFTQRIYTRLGPALLERLDPDDRRIFASLGG
jgi:Cd2+/Zn2+-exporting ATPase